MMGVEFWTEENLCQISAQNKLSEITTLDLSNRNLNDIDGRLLERLLNLSELNLSNNNNLTEFPKDVRLAKLEKLDISETNIEHLEFVQNLPLLKDLDTTASAVEPTDKHIAVELCPDLKTIGGDPVDSMKVLVGNLKQKFIPEVQGVWRGLYEDKYSHGIPPQDYENVLETFISNILKSTSVNTSMVHLRNFLVKKLAVELLDSVKNDSYQPLNKRRRIKKKEYGDEYESPSFKLPDEFKVKTPKTGKSSSKTTPVSRTPSSKTSTPDLKSNNSKTGTPGSKTGTPGSKTSTLSTKTATPGSKTHGTKTVTPSSKAATPSTKTATPSTKTPTSSKTEKTHSSSKKKENEPHPKFTTIKDRKTINALPSVDDYEPLHFIRCHFNDALKGTDPTDGETEVWRCVFEPDPNVEGANTNIVATCGGNMVCMIDCKTGHIMKRFRQLGVHMYSLAWTTLELENEGRKWNSNILIAAGFNRHVKLIHPDQNVCYSEFTALEKKKSNVYISCILIHPHKPTWVFFGMSDGLIALWNIGVPSGPRYEVEPSHLQQYTSVEQSVLNFVFCVKTGHLVGGCENGIYGWKVKEKKEIGKHYRTPDKELVLPDKYGHWDDDVITDALVQIRDDLVASKTGGTGCIYIWQLSVALLQKGDKDDVVEVTPLYALDWSTTQEPYINLGYNAGFLTCGDFNGRILIYNIDKMIKSKKPSTDELIRPSRMLDWPQCDISSKRDLEKKMTDLEDPNKKIVVNHASSSCNHEFLVACTNNNLVCIWKVMP